MLNLSLLAAASLTPFDCAPLPGAAAIVARREIRWLLVGETHGTNEMPRAAADMVCAAIRRGRPVVAAIEHTTHSQAALDRYMASNGGAQARAELTAGERWSRQWADGKSSRAMVDYLDWLRVRHQRGEVTRVVAFSPHSSRSGEDRVQQMASNLQAIKLEPRGIVIALTGSFHARRRVDETDAGALYLPVGARLPSTQTFSLRVRGVGGQTWSCQGEAPGIRCGVHDARVSGSPGRRIRVDRQRDRAYDAMLDLGIPTTASPPIADRMDPAD